MSKLGRSDRRGRQRNNGVVTSTGVSLLLGLPLADDVFGGVRLAPSILFRRSIWSNTPKHIGRKECIITLTMEVRHGNNS